MNEPNYSEEIEKEAKAYDLIGEKYEKVFGENKAQVAAIKWLIENLSESARVLDLGSGTGVPVAKMLSEAGFEVQGIDISPEMLKIARRKAPLAKFQLMNIEQIDLLPKSVDAIVACFSLLALRKSAILKTLAKVSNILSNNGYFLCSMIEGDSDFTEMPFLGTRVMFSAYQKEELKQILKSYQFKILQMQTVDFVPLAEASPEKQLWFFCQLKK